MPRPVTWATWAALKFNLIIALLITYLLMAGLFESWLYPLVIMVSVPLAALLRLGPAYNTAARKAFERVLDEYPDSDRAAEAGQRLKLL